MKYLNGSEIAEFIKERQAREVRRLRQSENIQPKLVIISTKDDLTSQLYMRLKKKYGEDISVEVEVINTNQADALRVIQKLNDDKAVHGIIVQLPLPDGADQEKILSAVAKEKDVDGLASESDFKPATPLAINWLLDGYSIDLTKKKILIIGKGRLVGGPLLKMWKEQGLNVSMADSKTDNLDAATLSADVIVTATGKPGLLTSEMIGKDSVVVDAGIAEVDGKTVGDLDQSIYDREDLTLTPKKGGVGPLTVSALFDNVLKSANS